MNRVLVVLLLYVLCSPAGADVRGALADLSALRWTYRLLVIREPPDINHLRALLEAQSQELDERKVAWFILDGDRLHTNFTGGIADSLPAGIRTQTDFREATTVLIGLDGGIKLRLAGVDLDTLYSAIDAMPMRRYERLR